ncbi:uncharacterized protein [Misgurnus anguillicaudatus]|uniref:uncharacterized protein isoform X2 n=1 Tax=Misgurnus anguillicaudatus TaxID=75329 RepID=UPI003CCFAC8F
MRRISVNQSLKARVSALEKDHWDLNLPHGEDKQSWMMGAVNVVLLVLLVWTSTAVSEADDDIPITCKNVTAHVGDEITLTCTVSYPIKRCCAVWYKFMTTAADDDPIIYREHFIKDPCIQKSTFSCPYTAKKAMTTNFIFFLQTTCGRKTTYFSVKITGRV